MDIRLREEIQRVKRGERGAWEAYTQECARAGQDPLCFKCWTNRAAGTPYREGEDLHCCCLPCHSREFQLASATSPHFECSDCPYKHLPPTRDYRKVL